MARQAARRQTVGSTVEPLWYGKERTRSEIVRWVSRHYTARQVSIEDHFLPCAEIAIVKKGSFSLLAGSASVRLTAGSFALFPPNSRQRSAEGENRGLVYWVGIDPGAGRAPDGDAGRWSERLAQLSLLIERSACRVVPLTPDFATSVERYFDLCHRDCRNPFLLSGASWMLLGALEDALCAGGSAVGGAAELVRYRSIRPALDAIHALPELTPSVEQLASACGMGRTHFATAFREAVGYTPRDYYNYRRIQKACELLRSPSAGITRIALDLGFSTPQYFATCFRKYTGMAPKEYREKGESLR